MPPTEKSPTQWALTGCVTRTAHRPHQLAGNDAPRNGPELRSSATARRKKNKQEAKRTEEAVIALEKEPVISLWALLFNLVIVTFFAWTLWEAREWWFRARLFPWAIGFAGLALALLQLRPEVAAVVRSGRTGGEKKTNGKSALTRQRTLSMAGWILGFFAAIWLLGFAVAVPLTILFYLKASARERWPISIALACLGWLSFYGIFDYLLHVPFPEGQLFTWIKQVL